MKNQKIFSWSKTIFIYMSRTCLTVQTSAVPHRLYFQQSFLELSAQQFTLDCPGAKSWWTVIMWPFSFMPQYITAVYNPLFNHSVSTTWSVTIFPFFSLSSSTTIYTAASSFISLSFSVSQLLSSECLLIICTTSDVKINKMLTGSIAMIALSISSARAVSFISFSVSWFSVQSSRSALNALVMVIHAWVIHSVKMSGANNKRTRLL